MRDCLVLFLGDLFVQKLKLNLKAILSIRIPEMPSCMTYLLSLMEQTMRYGHTPFLCLSQGTIKNIFYKESLAKDGRYISWEKDSGLDNA